MIEVALHGAEFFARHGYYPAEQQLGNRFMVDVEVGFDIAGPFTDDELADTLNYETLYQIAEAEMKITRKLLETVAQAIVNRIKNEFNFAATILVRVKKLSPPLKGKVKYSAVTITYKK